MQKNLRTLNLLLAILIIAFIALTAFVIKHPLPEIDFSISKFVQQYHSDTLDKVMLAISFFGELPWSLVMVLVVAGIFFAFKHRREAYFITAILASGLVILGAKHIFNRPRPTELQVRLVEINRFQSFPSGHVTSYILFFGFMIVLMKYMKNLSSTTRKVITYISAFYMITIPISRIYLGAHWFTDVMAGLLLGLICLYPLSFFYLKRNGDKA
ncbi:MAG: phosphatase PAP2 family protein [Flavobacterium sp.]|nr:MAG: phosphatase PAP2 family protein [Flavobacterium sp.]